MPQDSWRYLCLISDDFQKSLLLERELNIQQNPCNTFYYTLSKSVTATSLVASSLLLKLCVCNIGVFCVYYVVCAS